MQANLSIKQLLRLGMFQLGAGMVSVVLLGMLNRVLTIELGMSLLAVSVMIGGGHYLGALVSIPIGHTSDRFSWRGYHRMPFIAVGTALIALLTVLAPFFGLWAAQDPSALRIGIGFLYFALQGTATYTAGTVYLSLITDLSNEEERGKAVGLIWTMLMVGILAGVFIGVVMLNHYSFAALVQTFALVAGLVLVLSAIALWKQEKPYSFTNSDTLPLAESLKLLWGSRQTRLFFIFLIISLFSYFMQDIVLEPFGGQVFALSVAETTRFNAYMMVGVIGGILAGGLKLTNIWGKKRVAQVGNVFQVFGFAMLAIVSIWRLEGLVAVTILAVGAGMGLFTAGSVSMMMDMTIAGKAGLFAGAWTLATALAKAPASIVGGAVHQAVFNITQSYALAYGAVFALEAVGLVITLIILNEIAVENFKREVKMEALLTAAD